MAVNVQVRGSRHQLRVTHRLLPRGFFATFDIEREARDYGDQLQAMLDRGVVPQELIAAAPKGEDPLLIEVIRGYTVNLRPPQSCSASGSSAQERSLAEVYLPAP